MKAILAVLASLAVMASGAGEAASAPQPDGFEAFWAQFRQAALQSDMGKLEVLTRLPLQVGFEADQDHPQRVSRSAFTAYFKTELKCQSADAGSNLDMIRNKVQPNGRFDFHDEHRATIGMYAFAKDGGRWRLTLLNLGDIGEHRSLLKGRCS